MNSRRDNLHVRDLWTSSAGYQHVWQNQQQINRIIDLLQLKDATVLLDIGCGNGVFAIEAAHRFPACQVWACDPLESAVAECRKKTGTLAERNFHIVLGSATSVPVPDNCADRVLMRNVLHHVPRPDAAIAEMARLMKQGARLVLEGPCNVWDESFGVLLSDIHMVMDDSHRRTYLRLEAIQDVLCQHGLYIEATESWPYPFRVNDEQVRLLKDYKAEEPLELCKQPDGRWFIQLRMACMIVTKKPSHRDYRNEKRK